LLWKESTPEEKEKMIQMVADWIRKYELETPAIFLLDTIKPLVTVFGNLGRVSLAFIMPLIGHIGENFINTFDSAENVEKLLQIIEKPREEKVKLEKEDVASPKN
jgi:hypothetical protein